MNEILKQQLEQARSASRKLALRSVEEVNRALSAIADAAERNADKLLAANAEDLARMDSADPRYDRLRLTPERIREIAEGIRSVAALESPVGKVLSSWQRPNGMRISKVAVPFGVIGIIYEARPNVTFDVAALCLKTQNACVLKGGSDADSSNRAIAGVIAEALRGEGFDESAVSLLPADHELTRELLCANGYVDLVIPRGSGRLIRFVRDNATVPVIETGAGICHCYFHSSGDLEKGRRIVENAKTRRVSVCNALDCLVIDRSRLTDLPALVAPLAEKQVVLYCDAPAMEALAGKYPFVQAASEESWGHEYLDYKMSVKTVADMDEALEHIVRYSSKHSESIVAEEADAIRRFEREVDAACVYANLPTSFTDGGQFGFGAEIGISTQKLHARGPMGLAEITTYKYIIDGDGQIRRP